MSPWVNGRKSITTASGVPNMWPVQLLPPTGAIASGLCDGIHLDFIHQEGTAFRGWLWRDAKRTGLFEGCKLAGDWLLWTKMARLAELYHLQIPLGRFQFREGQLSSGLDKYRAEIDRFMPENTRTQSFLEFLQSEGARCKGLFWDNGTNGFVSRELRSNRFAIADVARNRKPELSERIAKIFPERAKSRDTARRDPSRDMLTALNQSVDSAQLQQPLDLSEDLAATNGRYARLAGRHVQRLAEDDNLDQYDWKTVAWRHPWKVSRWLALRRYQRSKPV